MENPLNVWLFSTGKMVTNSSRQNVTHFMFDGGKLDISTDHETFQLMYSKNIHHKNCIVERKTEFFRYFIDFDVLSEEIIDLDQYIEAIQTTISNIYKQNELLCIITGANKNKEIVKEEKTYIKQGFHLHWPSIIVDKEIAKSIRKCVIVNLTSIFGKKDSHYDSWEKIIDRCVYETNGLRLVGSDKCNISDGNKTYENRIYILKDIYVGNKKDTTLRTYYENNVFQLVKDTSIRSEEKIATNVYKLDVYEDYEEEIKTTGNLINIKKDSCEYKSIEKFFRLHASGYKAEDIRTISQIKDKQMYLISSRSKFCQNKQDFHSNNHVYFKLTPNGLCQKCLSDNNGIHGPCREYQSKSVAITTALESSLNWKKPKSKKEDVNYQKIFSIPNLLEQLENNITGKDGFSGPGKKK